MNQQENYGNQGQGQHRPSKFWDQLDQMMFQRLFQHPRMTPNQRQFLESIHGKREVTNKMKCILHQIYCEQFQRPSKDVIIRAWQPREGYQDQQQSAPPAQPPQYSPPPQTWGHAGQPTYAGPIAYPPTVTVGHPSAPPPPAQPSYPQGQYPAPNSPVTPLPPAPQPEAAGVWDWDDDEDSQ